MQLDDGRNTLVTLVIVYFWESTEIMNSPLGRVSVSQKIMILLGVLRFGVDFNRPLNHFVQQMKEDDDHL